jgi:hypothetical protein
MVERHWEDIRDKRLRYRDGTWELSGDVDVLRDGDVVAVEATRVDGSRHEDARLYFGVEDPPGSLNPGDPGEQFHSLVREGDDQFLRVRAAGRSYRYELQRIEYQ